jgi:hypothetical protein
MLNVLNELHSQLKPGEYTELQRRMHVAVTKPSTKEEICIKVFVIKYYN